MSNLRSYASLAQFRARNNVDVEDTSDDSRFLAKLRSATSEIERVTQRIFQPISEARKFDWEGSFTLWFRAQALLTLTSIVDATGNAIASNAIILLGGANDTYGPYYAVELDPTKAYFLYQTTRTRVMIVTGVWGYHDDYANAWHDSAVTVSADSGTTTITTSNNNGADVWGQSPALSPGQMIQIESEWLQVIAVPDSTHITVARAQNGTSAVNHANGKAISVYEAPRDIQEVCVRWAAYLLAQDSSDFSKTVIPMMGQTLVPSGLPPDIIQNLIPYRKIRVA